VDILVCIDDTDDIETRGTGEIAELLAGRMEEADLARCGRVTRHQLLVHPDIAYTSHNSAMCFPATVDGDRLDEVVSLCRSSLAAESAPAADPGLCVVAVDRLARPQALIDYGREAKARVIAKAEAYELAADLDVHLSEHGGTGIGVIGALAGAGLRLSGDDGRFRGKFRIPGDADGVASVGEIRTLGALGVDEVRVLDGAVLADDERVLVGAEGKLVLLGGRAVLLVRPSEPRASAPWTVVDRRSLRSY
jgi:hypothetical protein